MAAEKRRLEAEARQKAVVDAEAKRQADVELEQARQAREKAEQELAQLKTDTETRRQSGAGQRDGLAAAAQHATEEDAQRKAEAQAASLRQAEEAAAIKAAADAEAKRQADEALAKAEAERQRAEADARAMAEAETAARRQASEEDQRKAEAEAASKRHADEAKAQAQAQAQAQAEREKGAAEAKAKADAEAAERTLRLEGADRERLQVALTSLGYDTRGTDGLFGPRSREMIAGWQKKAGVPATGFLTTAQQQALLREAAPALSKYDEQKLAEEQKKVEERKKGEEEARARASAAVAPDPSQPNVARAVPSGVVGLPDGTYRGGVSLTNNNAVLVASMALKMTNGIGTGTATSSTCGSMPMSLNVNASGSVTGDVQIPNSTMGCVWSPFQITGRVEGGKLMLVVIQANGFLRAQTTLTLGGAAPAAAASGPSAPPDGLWRGTYSCLISNLGNNPLGKDPEFTASLDIQLTNGSGSWKSSGPTSSNGYTHEIRVSVGPSEPTVTRFHAGQGYMGGSQAGLSGQYDGNAIRATGMEKGTGRHCSFVLTRA
ncbi:MAG TPA: peptidoglycan-binding protein [Reyranella sp.]|nr:peptidoglycan-binding protein [Reyranella sp.]